eukprot:7661048-Pyramimonas_sp.AAC.1
MIKHLIGEDAVASAMFTIILSVVIAADFLFQGPAGESGQRRRLRGKQAVPGRQPLAVVTKPGPLDTSAEGAMDNLEINGRL